MDTLLETLNHWNPAADLGLTFWWLAIAVLLVFGQFALQRYAAHSSHILVKMVGATYRPFLAIFLLLIARSSAQFIKDETFQQLANHSILVLLIISGSWWVLAAARAGKNAMLARLDITVADNFHARQIYTRVSILYRLFQFLVIVLTLAFVLLTFEAVQALGTSLLAGAGVTGIILGFAAQKTLGSIIAGIQIALTQPIKLDDAVVIEGEWGWIEEITLTYVVVRIWDLRRLIVPITYFVETPIQNWTRREAEIIGNVVLYTDYQVPLEPLRKELTRLLENSPHWNGNVNVLQVIDTMEHTIKLRALMSGKDSPTTWDLRCEVREGLINWLQKNHPESLPRLRLATEEKIAPRKKATPKRKKS